MMAIGLFSAAIAGIAETIVMSGGVIYAAILESILITLTIAFVVRFLESEYMCTYK